MTDMTQAQLAERVQREVDRLVEAALETAIDNIAADLMLDPDDVQDAYNAEARVEVDEPTMPDPDACKADECRGHLTADRTVTYC